MKIVLIGGGSFVFAPTVVEDILLKHNVENGELVLVDIDKEAVEIIGKAAQKLARQENVGISVNFSTQRKKVLSGADYVIVAAAIQGKRRWMMDYEILDDLELTHQARENGGIGGLSYAFRSIKLVMDICRDMEKLCPEAVLLNLTNPLPQVVTAVNTYSRIKGIGFCNIAWRGESGYSWVSDMLNKEQNELEVVSAGLNHFSWLVKLRDKNSGKDLLPHLIDKIQKGETAKYRAMRRWYNEFGAIIAGVVDHHGEFLPFSPDVKYAESPPFHGDDRERTRLKNNLIMVAEGDKKWQEIKISKSWEHPVDVAVALENNENTYFPMLNLSNQGYIPELPEGCTVEVPAEVCAGKGIKGKVISSLPHSVIRICKRISRVHQLTAQAAVKGDRELAYKVLEIDPAVIHKNLAKKALARMFEAHSDIICF